MAARSFLIRTTPGAERLSGTPSLPKWMPHAHRHRNALNVRAVLSTSDHDRILIGVSVRTIEVGNCSAAPSEFRQTGSKHGNCCREIVVSQSRTGIDPTARQ